MSTTTTDTRRSLQYRIETAAGPVVVCGHRFHATGPWMLNAWEPSEMGSDTGHNTIMSSDLGTHSKGQWWGRIGCRRLPADLDALPRGSERLRRVEAWHRAQYAEAYQLIVQALNQAGETELAARAEGTKPWDRVMGEIIAA
jgi:hypothetical protein